MSTQETDYGTAVQHTLQTVDLPNLAYHPRLPAGDLPKIGLIACGGITSQHLTGYRKDGLDVVALCDLVLSKAEGRRDEFYPGAFVTTDYRQLLERDDITVVDIAAHPVDRPVLIEAALRAGKHVLSQKPFVLDIAEGERLAGIAREMNRKLAVNQNGRWAPYFAYLREAVNAGLLGEISSIEMSMNWDHSWIKGTAFESIEHIILYDFAIHWFDICATIMGTTEAERVFALEKNVPGQPIQPPLSASAMIEFPRCVASLQFNGFSTNLELESIRVTGDKGTFCGQGKIIAVDQIQLNFEGRKASGTLGGSWFPDGMRGAMNELLCAIAENREPLNSAESALRSLRLCFAAIESARSGKIISPADITGAGPGCITRTS